MTENYSTAKELAKATGSFLSHGAAMMVGVVLMIVGLAMGVSVVLLPIGVPVGLLGLLAFLWGIGGSTAG
jgi:hypothetical protein